MSDTKCCWFQVDSVWYKGSLHKFSTETLQVSNCARSVPVGIVEDFIGRLHSIDVNDIIIRVPYEKLPPDTPSPPSKEDDGPIPRQEPRR
jgi:hypothetical protein